MKRRQIFIDSRDTERHKFNLSPQRLAKAVVQNSYDFCTDPSRGVTVPSSRSDHIEEPDSGPGIRSGGLNRSPIERWAGDPLALNMMPRLRRRTL